MKDYGGGGGLCGGPLDFSVNLVLFDLDLTRMDFGLWFVLFDLDFELGLGNILHFINILLCPITLVTFILYPTI